MTKSTTMIRSLLAVLLYSSIIPCLYGQQDESESSRISFKVTRFDPLDRKAPNFRTGDTDFEVPLNYIAGPFKATLRDGQYLDLWRGKTEKPELSVKIGTGERNNLLLVFIPHKTSFKVLKVNLSQKEFKGGGRYIVNTTKNDLAIMMKGMKPLLVKTKKSAIVNAPGNKSNLPVQIKQRNEKSWQLVSSENWYFDKRFRKILFIYRSPSSHNLLFHGIEERL